jgi:hypothetical protein
MSNEGPSDPDLLDLDDLPDTASIGQPAAAGRLRDAIAGLLRWARRTASERRSERAQVRGVIIAVLSGSGAVVVALATAIWYGATLAAESRTEARALREDVSELRAAIERVEERQWSGGDRWRRTDTTTHASAPDEE